MLKQGTLIRIIDKTMFGQGISNEDTFRIQYILQVQYVVPYGINYLCKLQTIKSKRTLPTNLEQWIYPETVQQFTTLELMKLAIEKNKDA